VQRIVRHMKYTDKRHTHLFYVACRSTRHWWWRRGRQLCRKGKVAMQWD